MRSPMSFLRGGFGADQLAARRNRLAAYAVGGKRPFLVHDYEHGYLSTPLGLTRASAGTFVDTSGTIQTAAADVPRFDYSTGARKLLVEGSATNFVTRSSHTDAYPWGTNVTHNGITATLVATGTSGGVPYADYSLSGTNTASYSEPFVAGSFSRTPAVVGQTWTASIYTQLISGIWPAGVTLGADVIEETAGNVFAAQSVPPVAPSAVMTRVSQSRTMSIANVATVRSSATIRGLGAAGATTFTGQVIRVFGWQLERGASATSLIQTLEGVSVTRAADYVVPLDLSGYDLSAGYSVVAWGQMDAVAALYDRVFQLDDGNNANRQTGLWNAPVNRFTLDCFSGGISQGGYGEPGGPQLGQLVKMAFAVGPNYWQAARNGVVSPLDTSCIYTVPNVLRLAQSISGDKPARLPLSRVALFAGRLTGAQLAEITT